ncbi:hypothetical protein DVDV_2972 [Desulfovibrio sp. DV]|nr:hypothetical protein DVDV_2972 [Desulfovibrio sp. DV]
MLGTGRVRCGESLERDAVRDDCGRPHSSLYQSPGEPCRQFF